LIAFVCHGASAADYPPPHEGDFVVRGFQFKSGERLAELTIHYATFGSPRTRAGRTVNAVLLLHSTGGSSRQYITPNFAGVLFAPGQLLDAQKYFIIIPDNIGHGKSSKPSGGLRMRFPHYAYERRPPQSNNLTQSRRGAEKGCGNAFSLRGFAALRET